MRDGAGPRVHGSAVSTRSTNRVVGRVGSSGKRERAG